MRKDRGFNPQFVVTWNQLQGYYQVETPFPGVNVTSILTSSEEEIIKKLYDWLHLNDKLRPPRAEPKDPRHPQEPPKPVTASEYLKDLKKHTELIGRCSRCLQVDEMWLFRDGLCYCMNCVPCL